MRVVWASAPVDEQPEVTLEQWMVVETGTGERRLMGYCLETCAGRVSSPVLELDVGTLRATTTSGRSYLLRGRPGLCRDAMFIWERFSKTLAVTSWTDVSPDVWARHRGIAGDPRAH
jgi:hypothetical protein